MEALDQAEVSPASTIPEAAKVISILHAQSSMLENLIKQMEKLEKLITARSGIDPPLQNM